jgi:hypothetical protein
MFRRHGKQTEIRLGSARQVSLAEARKLAGDANASVRLGINPKDARNRGRRRDIRRLRRRGYCRHAAVLA